MHVNLWDDLNQFIDDYRSMTIAPLSNTGIQLYGKFRFKANVSGKDEIKDVYQLNITVPENFPKTLPIVEETGGKIPRDGNFHVNEDGSLCLGSPLRLLVKIHDSPTLCGFAKNCIIPFLYAVSYKLRNGGDFVLGELPHGKKGIFQDYSILLGLKGEKQIIQAIKLLGMKKRIANKKICPCGCGKRLGICQFHHKLT